MKDGVNGNVNENEEDYENENENERNDVMMMKAKYQQSISKVERFGEGREAMMCRWV